MDSTNTADVATDTPEPAHVLALKLAIKSAGGTQAKLAEKMRPFAGEKRPSQALIWYWLKNQIRISDEWWVAIEGATGGVVTRKHLRPDLFG